MFDHGEWAGGLLWRVGRRVHGVGALSIDLDGRECLLLRGAIGNGEKISREWTEEKKKMKNHPFQASQSCV